VSEGTGKASGTQEGTGNASGTWETGSEFVARAIENELLIIPGGIFSDRDTHFRISYAASEATIERGLDVLRQLR
jgi:aspartate aminotransferase